MKTKIFINTILRVIIVVSVVVGIYFYFIDNNIEGAPKSVVSKYIELKKNFSLFKTRLAFCKSDQGEEVYIVMENHGLGGVNYYYTKDGIEIGSEEVDDSIGPDEPKPLVEISSYDQCITLK